MCLVYKSIKYGKGFQVTYIFCCHISFSDSLELEYMLKTKTSG